MLTQNYGKRMENVIILYFKTPYDSRKIQEIMQKIPLSKTNDNVMNPTIPDLLGVGSSKDLGQSSNAMTRENNDQFVSLRASGHKSHGNAKNNEP